MMMETMTEPCISNPPVSHRHELEVPELCYREMFYPMGFPTELRTNSTIIQSQARGLWSVFEPRFGTSPIRVDVHVLDLDTDECPPAPVFRIALPFVISIADESNYCIADLERATSKVIITRATERHQSYLDYFFLGGAPLNHIATRYATPIHAGCVVRNGRGVLLCGDSGAGKSTLSYACARAGWTYVTDDATFLLHDRTDRLVTGNCHQVRFRPSAADLFHEVQGLAITPRAAGKPSIEFKTAPNKNVVCAATAQTDFIVFLNRTAPGPPALLSFPTDAARHYLRQVLYGLNSSLATQYDAIERLLTAKIFELRYRDLDWATQRLETLTLEGK
jgi:hypothetical protein